MTVKYNIPLSVKATEKTPLLDYNPKSGVFYMVGVSTSKETKEFYDPIIKWVEGYVIYESKKININIQLDWFNTPTSVILLKILKEFEKMSDLVTVNWYYTKGDDDMKEIGDDLDSIINIKINVIELERNHQITP